MSKFRLYLSSAKLWISGLLVLLLWQPMASYAKLQIKPLISAYELLESFDEVIEGQVILLDIRLDPASIGDQQARSDYQKASQIDELEFIQHAVHLPYPVWRTLDQKNPGKLIDLSDIQANIERLNYQPSRHIVIIHQGYDVTDFGSAARVYWTIKSAGIDEVSILDGGYLALAKTGLPTVAEPSYPNQSDFEVVWRDQWSTNLAEIKQVSEQEVLLDGRPADQFQGKTKHPAARTYGTIPKALSLSNFSWFKANNDAQLLPTEQLIAIAKDHNLLNQNQVIHSFCNTGHWAATNWFVLSEILKQQVKLYPGSFVEYASDANNPVANEPNRLVRLFRSLTN